MINIRGKIWINIVLFAVTVVSTFVVGISWSLSFKYADVLSQPQEVNLGIKIFEDPQVIYLSIIYALVLIIILLGHELGHFLTCQHYQIESTLPYFIPAPTLIGTLGAFIKIKSPITRKKQLFDIGVAGPLTGFVLAVPALVYGLSLSKVVPALPQEGTLVFGEPLLLKLAASIIFENIPPNHDIILHPVAFAGWVGIFVTALNLFPVGQLDGGHVSYALFGGKSKNLAKIFLGIFIIMGIFFWLGWFLWAFIILLLGLRHPRVIDEGNSLSPGRKFVGFLVLLIFILSFIPDPIKGYEGANLIEIIRKLLPL